MGCQGEPKVSNDFFYKFGQPQLPEVKQELLNDYLVQIPENVLSPQEAERRRPEAERKTLEAQLEQKESSAAEKALSKEDLKALSNEDWKELFGQEKQTEKATDEKATDENLFFAREDVSKVENEIRKEKFKSLGESGLMFTGKKKEMALRMKKVRDFKNLKKGKGR